MRKKYSQNKFTETGTETLLVVWSLQIYSYNEIGLHRLSKIISRFFPSFEVNWSTVNRQLILKVKVDISK